MAIDPRSLMLGNYVNISESSAEMRYCSRHVKITQWGAKGICHWEGEALLTPGLGKTISGSHHTDFDPIPITEQWLKDFGFEERSPTLFVKRMEEKALIPWVEAAIGFQNDEWIFAFRHTVLVKDLKHVHSLQNLMHSLGHEIKLQNDK